MNLPGVFKTILLLMTLPAATFNASARDSWPMTGDTVDVSKDLLLIYNTNSADSAWVKDYYLAHRPLVSGANVLGLGCTVAESVTRAEYTNTIRQPVLDWLAAHPAKHPHYWVLFLDVPSRIHYDTNYSAPPPEILDNSVSYELHSTIPGKPLVTHINMNGIHDCQAYIDKLEFIGTHYSPGEVVLSASAGGYGNTNFYFDDSRDPHFAYSPTPARSLAGQAKEGVLMARPLAAVTYANGADGYTNMVMHITSGSNLAGYLSWGEHSALGGGYPIDGRIRWQGKSGWWLIETVESFNGERTDRGMGNFIKWFSPNAFGGTNYENTPVGAVGYTDEPGLGGVNNASLFFGEWAEGKNFATAAWDSRTSEHFLAVGDPLVVR